MHCIELSCCCFSSFFCKRLHIVDRVNMFFQVEDGIRDGHVTGVQTCALPISIRIFLTIIFLPKTPLRFILDKVSFQQSWATKIGRASCRERMYFSEFLSVTVKKIEYKSVANVRRCGSRCYSKSLKSMLKDYKF